SAPGEFAALAHAVLGRAGSLTSCIVVLLGWDEARRAFVQALRGSALELRVLLVCERAEAPPPAPGVIALHPGEIAAGLARLA
ncbi:MAG TPA: hypothetical protein VLU41_11800, partial [Ideonella sp.]|nr:hypothetical protein [Ideonella sp.]